MRSVRGAWLAIALAATAAVADEPIVDHQPVDCVTPESFPRVCAYLVDDGQIQQARTYFKTVGQEQYYWVEMTYDGAEFCATLPSARKRESAIVYYVWAVDDSYTPQRSPDHRLRIEASCPHPVVDDDAARQSEIVVHATTKRQGSKIKGFVADAVRRFVPVD